MRARSVPTPAASGDALTLHVSRLADAPVRCAEAVAALRDGTRRVNVFTHYRGADCFAFAVIRGPRDFAVVEHLRRAPKPQADPAAAVAIGAELLPVFFEQA